MLDTASLVVQMLFLEIFVCHNNRAVFLKDMPMFLIYESKGGKMMCVLAEKSEK